jgi:hypothetical protein
MQDPERQAATLARIANPAVPLPAYFDHIWSSQAQPLRRRDSHQRIMHVQATITNVRSLVLALQAIKTPHKLPCAVTFEAGSGMSLRFLDSAHTIQSGFSLSPAVSGGCPCSK